MDHDAFEAIVRKAEEHANRNPAGYRRKVVVLGLIGYAYLGLLIAVSLGSVAALGWLALRGVLGNVVGVKIGLQLGVPVLLFVVVLLRAMWIRIGAPGGIPLERRRVPALFETLDEIRTTLAGPRIHQVLLDDQLNAFITQVPRLGIFGWHRNYLVIGLPLLHALGPDELRAVLAHEYGHLSGSHGKIGAWIYRVRATWSRLRGEMAEKEGFGAAALGAFFERYAPYFGAYSFVLARANEYEADAAAADVAGAENQGAALVRLATIGPWLEREFWPEVFATLGRQPEPPEEPFQSLAALPALRHGPDEAPAALARALELQTDLADTHPCLRERLQALGVEPLVPAPPTPSAAESFLGAALPDLQQRLDHEWREHVRPLWAEELRKFESDRKQLAELRSSEGPRTGAEEMELARLTARVEGREAALPLYRTVLERDPTNLEARLVLAMYEVQEGDEAAGRAEMETIMDEGDQAFLLGAHALLQHYADQGHMEAAEALQERLMERQAALAERYAVPLEAVYEPHDLSRETVAGIVHILELDARVRSAHLVRRHPERSSKPVYLLVVQCWRSWEDPTEELAQALGEVPLDIVVLVLRDSDRRILAFVETVDDAHIV